MPLRRPPALHTAPLAAGPAVALSFLPWLEAAAAAAPPPVAGAAPSSACPPSERATRLAAVLLLAEAVALFYPNWPAGGAYADAPLAAVAGAAGGLPPHAPCPPAAASRWGWRHVVVPAALREAAAVAAPASLSPPAASAGGGGADDAASAMRSVLQRLTAPLRDGHVAVGHPAWDARGCVPVDFTVVMQPHSATEEVASATVVPGAASAADREKLAAAVAATETGRPAVVVAAVGAEARALGAAPGDVVVRWGGRPAAAVLAEPGACASAATPLYRHSLALRDLVRVAAPVPVTFRRRTRRPPIAPKLPSAPTMTTAGAPRCTL